MQVSKQNASAAAVVVVVLSTVVWLALTAGVPTSPEAGESAAPSVDTVNAPIRTVEVSPAAAPTAVTPSVIAKKVVEPLVVARDFAALSAAAAVGNRLAACKLGTALSTCRELDRWERVRGELQRTAEKAAEGSESEDAAVAALVDIETKIQASSAMCDGVTPQQGAMAWRYVLKAAQLGDGDSAVTFVTSPPLDPDNMLSDIDGWRAYRDSVWPLLQAQIANGDVRALFLAYGLASGQDSLMGMDGPLIPPDPVVAAQYASVLARVLDDRSARRVATLAADSTSALTAQQRDAAERAADRLYTDKFDGIKGVNPTVDMFMARSPADCN